MGKYSKYGEPWYRFGEEIRTKTEDDEIYELFECSLGEEDGGLEMTDRAVACVNACQGINPEVVPKMLAMLEALSAREWVDRSEIGVIEPEEYYNPKEEIDALISEAKGETDE